MLNKRALSRYVKHGIITMLANRNFIMVDLVLRDALKSVTVYTVFHRIRDLGFQHIGAGDPRRVVQLLFHFPMG